MSEMLAVLLGAGGGKGAHAIGQLSAGKADAKQAQEAGAGDPFMEVLFARLNPATTEAAVDGEELLTGQVDEASDDATSKPLETALLHAQAASADAAFQALLATPMAVAGGVPESHDLRPDADAGFLGLSMDKGLSEFDASFQPISIAVAQGAATQKQTAAESAAVWQALPAADEGAEPLSALLRADPSQNATTALASSGGVVQSLAAQFREAMAESGGKAVDPLASGPGQASASMAGVAVGMAGDVAGRPTAASVHLSVEAPLRSPMFPQALGERVIWLSSRQGQVAEIALNPPHLGPLEVKLSLAGGEAGAQFFSPHPQVREAIEAALPKLREMMTEAGVSLGQTQVRDEAFPRQEAPAHNEARQGSSQVEGDEQGAAGIARAGPVRAGLGLVDLYA